MKTIFLIAALLGAALAQGGYFYSTADDSYDIDSVVRDPESLRSLTDCFLDKEPCDKVAQSYRDLIPDALSHGCQRCTAAQRHMASTYLRALSRNLPKDYVNFLQKYDPQGSFIDNFATKVQHY